MSVQDREEGGLSSSTSSGREKKDGKGRKREGRKENSHCSALRRKVASAEGEKRKEVKGRVNDISYVMPGTPSFRETTYGLRHCFHGAETLEDIL